MTEEKFVCKYCGRECKTNQALSYHQSRCKENPQCIKQFRIETACQFCGKVFNSKFGAIKHEKNYCENNPNKIRPKKSYKICDKCGEEISTLVFENHYRSCDGSEKRKYRENPYHLDHDDLICKFCGKECKNKNSLVQHEIRCKENPQRIVIHISQAGINAMLLYNSQNGVWNKGLTKETSKSIQKGIDTFHKHLADGSIKLSSGTASTPENEQKRKEKISNSMQLAVKEGRHKTSCNSGSGYKSYIQIFDQIYFLRSSYELIYSYYLAINKIKFEIESIRVQAVENPYRKIFISDFYIPAENKIVETKGWETEKDLYEKQSFEKEGYNFQLINGKEIDIIKKKLINYIDIEYILNQLKSNQNNIYYTFNLTQYYK